MSSVRVRHLDGDRFAIAMRDQQVVVDQPLDLGGEDTGPTPTELFIGSVASCVAFYARRYLVRHHLPTDGLAVTAEYVLGTHPSRVTDIAVAIELPPGVPPERRDPLLAVASHCTVHNSLTAPPEVTVVLAGVSVG